ncbi:MAG: signal peptidase II [Alphaproteobacteria bacterium]|nr:signal peptidase II [Alphaproteobacteria bacterium]MBL0717873.1 signal peptidase II [Alphaproteobacteria bacterium]
MRKLHIIILIIAISFILDQLTKFIIMGQFFEVVPLYSLELLPEVFLYKVSSFFNLVLVYNTGSSFSLGAEIGIKMPWIFLIIYVLIMSYLIRLLFIGDRRFEIVSLSLVLGGALGNFIDRIRFNSVVDFLHFHGWGYHWPVFNLADSFIVIGVFLYIICGITASKKKVIK